MELAPFAVVRGCQGFIGPYPSAFLDKHYEKNCGAKVKEHLTKVEVWIPGDAAYPVQQQFYEPSGNYRTVTYNNIRLNPPMTGTLELKMAPGTKKQAE